MFRPALITVFIMSLLLIITGAENQNHCSCKINLIDVGTNEALSGLIRVKDQKGNLIPLPELISRGTGMDPAKPQNQMINEWFVIKPHQTLKLPQTKLTIEAFSGLETEMVTLPVDLTNKTVETMNLPIVRFHNCSDSGYQAGNTHLHLKGITREECERYLVEIPKADELDLVFLSYLERQDADLSYTSNKYTQGDLNNLTRKSGILFGNGEEHRNNFTRNSEGFGHVMLLDIKQLILPVSIGSGIMKSGSDGIPLQRGIDQAHRDGGTVVWCHNALGWEDIPNFVTGRVDAQNIYDGGNRGSFEKSFYRYLNAGLKVPFSTGTDWFMYDFSRVYVKMNEKVTVKNWLDALSGGNTFITNGPLLEFSVSSREPGQTVSLNQPGILNISGKAKARQNFSQIELVQNGKVIHKATAQKVGNHYEAEMNLEFKTEGPCWLALRTPVRPEGNHQEHVTFPVNELGQMLFAHTSAIHVEMNGKPYYDVAVANELLEELKEDQTKVENGARFDSPEERSRVLDVYEEGQKRLREMITKHE